MKPLGWQHVQILIYRNWVVGQKCRYAVLLDCLWDYLSFAHCSIGAIVLALRGQITPYRHFCC